MDEPTLQSFLWFWSPDAFGYNLHCFIVHIRMFLSMRFETFVAVLALRTVQWDGMLCSLVVSH